MRLNPWGGPLPGGPARCARTRRVASGPARLGRIWTGSAGKSIHPRAHRAARGSLPPWWSAGGGNHLGRRVARGPSCCRLPFGRPEAMASASRSGAFTPADAELWSAGSVWSWSGPFGGAGCGSANGHAPAPPPPSYGLRGGEHAEINRNKGKTLARGTYCQVGGAASFRTPVHPDHFGPGTITRRAPSPCTVISPRPSVLPPHRRQRFDPITPVAVP